MGIPSINCMIAKEGSGVTSSTDFLTHLEEEGLGRLSSLGGQTGKEAILVLGGAQILPPERVSGAVIATGRENQRFITLLQ